MEKYCAKCGATFICRKDDITKCHCNKIELNTAAISFISKHYTDCLCPQCLEEINKKPEEPSSKNQKQCSI